MVLKSSITSLNGDAMAIKLLNRFSSPESYTTWVKRNGIMFTSQVTTPTVVQSVASEGHPYRLLGRTGGDIGGPFRSSKLEVRPGVPLEFNRYSGSTVVESGFVFAVPGSSVNAAASSASSAMNSGSQAAYDSALKHARDTGLSDSSMDALGATAINAVKPTNPTVELANTFAEFLSERKFFSLPSKDQGISGNYLNYMFGIAPTVDAAKDLRTAIEDREKIISQYRRDRGKPIRRSMSFPPEIVSSSTTEHDVLPTFLGRSPSAQNYQPGRRDTWTRVMTHTWFSGAFSYHYPDDGFGKTLAELDRLYGVVPDAGTAWELLPFSWLADYKLSAGAAINNMASFSQDGLVMLYGYLMRSTETLTVVRWEGPFRNAQGIMAPTVLESTYKYTQKQRQPANPFGFGVKPGGLNSRQASIIAALGISKFKGN